MAEGVFGDFAMAPGEARQWRLGPCTLVVTRTAGEWRLWSVDNGDVDATAYDVERLHDVPEPPPGAPWQRFVTAGDAPLRVAPALPDRAIVARPRETVFIPPGETVRVFVSVPVWISLRAGERPLTEIPTHRPSDTWFGPSNVEGEICYALRTRFRLEAGVSDTPHWRAVVPLTIRNDDDAVPAVQRLSVPVPLLALFAGADGRHWTESVVLTRESGNTAALRLEDRPPGEAGRSPRRVAEPRTPGGRRTMLRALGALFGN